MGRTQFARRNFFQSLQRGKNTGMNPFAFLWRQREAERPEKELSDVGVKEWPPAVYHREIYRQRLNDITIPCSNYYSVSQSSFTEYVGLAPPEWDWESYADFGKTRHI